jgi:predicted secreted protein
MKVHPYSEIFPLLEGSALDELAADIKKNGLREPIWTYRGQVLDGRNRLAACQKTNEKPRFQEFRGDDAGAQSFVISVNLHRRHLNESQRASIAAKLSKLEPGQRLETGKFAGLTQETAAKTLNVSERTVRAAKKVHEKGSVALNKALDAGEVSASKAASVVDRPKSEQLEAAQRKPAPSDEPARPEVDDNEDASLEAAERDWRARMDKILEADDRLAEMAKQLKLAQDELTAAKQARDRYMNENAALLRQNKALQRKLERLEKKAA